MENNYCQLYIPCKKFLHVTRYKNNGLHKSKEFNIQYTKSLVCYTGGYTLKRYDAIYIYIKAKENVLTNTFS